MNEDERLLREIEQASANQDSRDPLLRALVRARPQARPEFQKTLERRLLEQQRARSPQRRPARPAAVQSGRRVQPQRSLASALITVLILGLLSGAVLLFMRSNNSLTAGEIIYFNADRTNIGPDDCVILSYSVTSAQRITLQSSHWNNGFTEITNDSGQIPDCPFMVAAYEPGINITYTLQVTFADGRTESRTVVLQTLPITPTLPPTATLLPLATNTPIIVQQIVQFMAKPERIPVGGCTTLYYEASGIQTMTLRGPGWGSISIDVAQDNPGQQTICPVVAASNGSGEPLTYTLEVLYWDGTTASRDLVILLEATNASPSSPLTLTASPTSLPFLAVTPTPLPLLVATPTPRSFLTLPPTPTLPVMLTPAPTTTLPPTAIIWATPVPTNTPTFVPVSPTAVPTNTPSNYHIEYFRADPATIPVGGCTRLYYWAVGAQSVTLSASNWLNGAQIITDNPNGRDVCPSDADGYVPGEPVTYTLDVVYLDGTTDSRSAVVAFEP